MRVVAGAWLPPFGPASSPVLAGPAMPRTALALPRSDDAESLPSMTTRASPPGRLGNGGCRPPTGGGPTPHSRAAAATASLRHAVRAWAPLDRALPGARSLPRLAEAAGRPVHGTGRHDQGSTSRPRLISGATQRRSST